MATHSRILAWRTPWTEEPGGLSSIDCKGPDMTEMTLPAHKGGLDDFEDIIKLGSQDQFQSPSMSLL